MKARLKMLRAFRRDLEFWQRSHQEAEHLRIQFAHVGGLRSREVDEAAAKREKARRALNRNMLAAKTALRDVSLGATISVSPPPMLGGRVEIVDPFTSNLFATFHDVSPIPMVLDVVEQAIGAYEHLASGSGLVTIRQQTALDALQALTLGLRSGFPKGPPERELDVHDVAQTILTSHGIGFTRDKEVAVVGDRSYKPDFDLPDFDTCLEFKLCDAKKPPNDIQEQIAADVTGYKTRWKNCIFIVYDVNQIASVERFCEAIEKKWGVTVRVVKH